MATTLTPEVGKTFTVNHSRKGLFEGTIKSIDGEFCTIVITSGRARAMLAENERVKGEEVTIRMAHALFTAPHTRCEA